MQQTLPGVPLVTVRYSSNNSGGSWWLSDDDWRKLERHGWRVAWVRDQEHYARYTEDGKAPERWLGALAIEASKEFASVDAAVAEWESITGQDASDEGCTCCGRPHDFWEGK